MKDIWELEGENEKKEGIKRAGVYLVKVVKCNIMHSKKDFYEKILKLSMETEDGQVYEHFHCLRATVNWKFLWLLKAIGITKDSKLVIDWDNPSEHSNEIFNFAQDNFVGKQCKITLKGSEYNGKKKLELEKIEMYNERELHVEVKNDVLEDDDTVPF